MKKYLFVTLAAISALVLVGDVGASGKPKCIQRTNMYVSTYVERAGGTCGPKTPLTQYVNGYALNCTGTQVYSEDLCESKVEYFCTFPNKLTKSATEIQRWEMNGEKGMAGLEITLYRNGVQGCHSVYDVVYSRK